jgi:prevent-host-death family protein
MGQVFRAFDTPLNRLKMTITSMRKKVPFNIAQAKAQFSELVRRALAGEDVIIAKDNKPLLRLVPLEGARQPRKPGSAKVKIRMSPDFDHTPPDFKDYT